MSSCTRSRQRLARREEGVALLITLMVLMLVSALMAYAIVLHMFGLPLPRYNLPFKALEIALALAGLHALWVARRGREAHPAAARHTG